jgi:hypothetical protein
MRVLYGYAFRNALLPVVTTIGMVFSFMLGANVLVEKVFAWPGIGSFAVEALVASDYAPGPGLRADDGLLYVALNLAIDLLYWRHRSARHRAGERLTCDHRIPAGLGSHARHVIGHRESGDAGAPSLLFAMFIVLAVFGPWLAPYDPLATKRRSRCSRLRRSTGSAPIRWGAMCSRG